MTRHEKNRQAAREKIREAADKKDFLERAKAVRQALDYMRFILGYTSQECRACALEAGLSGERWEELCVEADEHGSEG